MKSFAVFVALVAAALPALASAQGPATVRGLVYSCRGGSVLPSVPVTLRSLDDGVVARVRTDANGRFARVGLTPGRYLISVSGEVPGAASATSPIRRPLVVSFASRLARLENDDVLDLAIGTELTKAPRNITNATSKGVINPALVDVPLPMCDPAIVPTAPSTSDRYIIH